MNQIQFYSLEEYLFRIVHQRFHEEGSLSAFDFFCIVIWKANRSKSRIAKALLARDKAQRDDLESIVRDITRELQTARTDRERFERVLGWGMRLPMASAILTVFWPEDFTVYDFRVCDALEKHHQLQNRTTADSLWTGYQEFIGDVRKAIPGPGSLRDKDKALWGKSFKEQLERDIYNCFRTTSTLHHEKAL
jgi:hypothetical protein